MENENKQEKQMMCFDTETSGFDTKHNALCSITLKVVGKDIIKTIFIKPNKNLKYEQGAFDVNHLSLDILEEKGVSEALAVKQIIDFMKANYIKKPMMLAHNASFDIGFMNVFFKRNGCKPFTHMFDVTPFDTLAEMRKLRTNKHIDIPNCKLNTCHNHFFGIDIENAHTSEGDVIATEKIYFKIVELLEQLKNGEEN